jgi:hypothetical protein
MTYEILLENDDKENYVSLATIGSTDVALWKVQTSGVPRGLGFQNPPRNSEVLKKLSQVSSSVENTPVTT